VQYHRVVSNRNLARILKNCRDLPGSKLFQYVDEDGVRHSIDSRDVNAQALDTPGSARFFAIVFRARFSIDDLSLLEIPSEPEFERT
jgi:DNA topoisomerase I